jgi:hypothetical protein
MESTLEKKLEGMFWDMDIPDKNEIINHILNEPDFILNDEQIALKLINTLTWYDLIHLLGIKLFNKVLSEKMINKLFPIKRRILFSNAKKLLSKYSLSSAG